MEVFGVCFLGSRGGGFMDGDWGVGGEREIVYRVETGTDDWEGLYMPKVFNG